MTSDLVVVTGASGYVAGHCILGLLEEGYRVRGTLRSLGRADEVRGRLTRSRQTNDPKAALSFVQTSLTDSYGWDAAMEGARYVMHVASPLPSRPPKDPDDLIVPARQGTMNVMEAAARGDVERVVHTSSSTTILYGRDNPNEHLFTEEDWTDPAHWDNVPYTRSKTLAEMATWSALRNLPRSMEWVSINPGFVLGPVLDRDFSASVLLLVKMLKGKLPGLPNIGYPIVDVRDLATLHLSAMTAPASAGERYLASGPFTSLSEIAWILKAGLGADAKRVPTRRLPDWLVRLAGLFDSEIKGQLFELGKVRRPSSAKALLHLGWSPRPVDQTILDTAKSLKSVGALN